jgi:DNA-binding CsgD family transcriptional regulator/tetratricopeptide (TPR) repeat protein
VPFQVAAVPRTVQEAVQRRSRQLSSAAHQVLNLAAVAGRQFDFALLQNALHFEEQELLRCIRELIAAQLVVEVSADEFAFRHALTRQAVYAGLLARERRTLHRIVGDTLEQHATATGDSLAADLSRHFYEAGAWAKARDHAVRAGERAQTLYAARAAIELFTRAIDATGRLALHPPPAMYHARGRAHETLGDFDGALADYELALGRALASADRRAEWQALLALGFLWTARDYVRTGDFLRRALALARELKHPDLLATSLNRLGNWHMNIEQLDEAFGFHEEALSIFRDIGDLHGLAETLDLLASATLTSGDLPRGRAYSEQAIALLREVDNRQGLASCLAIRVHCGETYLTNTLRPTMRVSETLGEGELALKTAREIGWRAGEAFAHAAIGHCLGAHGEYARALQVARESLAIADEIEHRQWRVAAHCLLGALYLDLLAPVAARQHLERALASARAIGSMIWVRYATGHLAPVYIMEREFARAEAVLDAAFDPAAPMQTLGQRLCWCARAELALAKGTPDLALRIVEQLAATSRRETDEYQIPRLGMLRGEALTMLRRMEEAEITLLAARETARAWGVRPLLWRIQIALGKLYRLNARYKAAEGAFADARAIITECAAPLVEENLREDFLRRADSLLPRRRPISPRRANKQASGGLTTREREVAMLVARGLTNRQIATQLVIAEETAAVHIKHILNTLGFASRAQIAAWVVQQPFFEAGS